MNINFTFRNKKANVNILLYILFQYLDYLMKVLLPEMLIKVHMTLHGCQHMASQQALAHLCNPILYKVGQWYVYKESFLGLPHK